MRLSTITEPYESRHLSDLSRWINGTNDSVNYFKEDNVRPSGGGDDDNTK
jgi:hypothetical protein